MPVLETTPILQIAKIAHPASIHHSSLSDCCLCASELLLRSVLLIPFSLRHKIRRKAQTRSASAVVAAHAAIALARALEGGGSGIDEDKNPDFCSFYGKIGRYLLGMTERILLHNISPRFENDRIVICRIRIVE